MNKYTLSYREEVRHEKDFEAESKDELEEKFFNGELELESAGSDIMEGNYIEGSLEIDPQKKPHKLGNIDENNEAKDYNKIEKEIEEIKLQEIELAEKRIKLEKELE